MADYYGIWAGEGFSGRLGRAAMLDDFEISESDLDGVEILYACYDIDGYEGSAFVLFRKDGKLLEVSAYHCSCMGLEQQWSPEPSNVLELRNRLSSDGYFAKENPYLMVVLEGERDRGAE